MERILNKEGFICDMDGVIYHGNKLLPGAADFVNWLIKSNKKFVFLTNSPERTPHELSMKLQRMDTDIIAGIESNMDTVLVLSGVTAKEDIDLFPYRPTYVLSGVGDLVK